MTMLYGLDLMTTDLLPQTSGTNCTVTELGADGCYSANPMIGCRFLPQLLTSEHLCKRQLD